MKLECQLLQYGITALHDRNKAQSAEKNFLLWMDAV
jgi:hypothetical protein